MTLYDIDAGILALINEDGEIANIEEFEALNMARDAKIENISLWVKNLEADARAIRDEEKALAERRKANENKAESLKNYLSYFLQGQKFNSPRVGITYRKSESAVVDDEDAFKAWAKEKLPHCLKVTVEVSKTELKAELKAGTDVKFARLVEKQNMQIK